MSYSTKHYRLPDLIKDRTTAVAVRGFDVTNPSDSDLSLRQPRHAREVLLEQLVQTDADRDETGLSHLVSEYIDKVQALASLAFASVEQELSDVETIDNRKFSVVRAAKLVGRTVSKYEAVEQRILIDDLLEERGVEIDHTDDSLATFGNGIAMKYAEHYTPTFEVATEVYGIAASSDMPFVAEAHIQAMQTSARKTMAYSLSYHAGYIVDQLRSQG